ncbi:MAG TPA: hypothetical protein VEJ63_09805, partial [Planctomycetota bacterium]|nr:hypothetical protein [Planctomycetota bacterium]
TDRRHGFESVFGHLGGVVSPDCRVEVARWGRADPLESMPRTVARWKETASVNRVTALFSFGDDYAADTAAVLLKNGVRIPQEFSIVGTTWHDHASIPGVGTMTVVRADLRALVAKSFDACVEIQQREKPYDDEGVLMRRDPILFVAPVALVTGESSAPVPK